MTRIFKKPDVTKVGLLLLTLVTFASAAIPAGAVPQVDNVYGDRMPWMNAEINAMGGTGVALYRGGISNIFNPALLAVEKSGQLDFSIALDQQHEDRFQPLFDTFDSYVTDAAIASNRNHIFAGGFAVAKAFSVKGQPITGAISLADRYPFSYTFDEQLRNPSPYPPGDGDPARDAIIEERMREVTGAVRNLSIGFGSQVHERIAVGAAVHYAFGTREETKTVRDIFVPENSYNHSEEFKLDGVNFTVGLQGKITERVEVGVSWESPLDAEGTREMTLFDATQDTVTSADGYYKYPSIYRCGLLFRPRTDPATVFTVEMEYIPWKEMEDDRYPGDHNPQNLDATTDVRIGLQHTFYNGMPLRFGFRHFNSAVERDANTSIFSAGIGAPFAGGMFSASLELAKLTTVQAHQFPYPAEYFGDNFETDPDARVEDTRFRVGIGYKANF